MNNVTKMVTAVLIAFALSGCTAVATPPTTTPVSAGLIGSAETGTDAGNDRPTVTYDGLMVRRRVVIAIHSTPDADLAALRIVLDNASNESQINLSDISPDVLDPASLEHLVPELIVALPMGGTVAEAGELVNRAYFQDPVVSGVDHYHVAEVLVHDLRFAVRATSPAALEESIAREGILSDALGNYTTTLRAGELDVTYTGPLLSDELIKSVQNGIARAAHTKLEAVTVSPRSTAGVGVDMANEPAPAPAATEAASDHNHDAAPHDSDGRIGSGNGSDDVTDAPDDSDGRPEGSNSGVDDTVDDSGSSGHGTNSGPEADENSGQDDSDSGDSDSDSGNGNGSNDG
ncbi:hypothetical protein E3T35_02880 [Cryobacterium sp. TMT1-2-2]|uniref:hypothetical protein n=1 Tax=Cryobacterium sp. TMT1-2-2 TaxID=1259233 RepID=UPI00106CA38D|nr:hypothetical protein [Cryobacterium sp. TMT1-2-2]TFD14355.1 hypothetical protein E3T35_02880 [Cryobacterium sp. TMT1-2-2]